MFKLAANLCTTEKLFKKVKEHYEDPERKFLYFYVILLSNNVMFLLGIRNFKIETYLNNILHLVVFKEGYIINYKI